jgi:hypothetical protein
MATALYTRSFGLGRKHWVCIYNDAHCSQSSFLDLVSIVYWPMLYIWLGGMDKKELWNDWELCSTGKY